MDLHVYRNSQDRWHDLKAAAAESGAVLGLNTITLAEFIEKLTPDIRPATSALRVVFARQALQNSGLTGIAAATRYALEAIAELKSAMPARKLEELDRIAPIVDICRTYNAQLIAQGLADYEDRCWTAAARVASDPEPWLRRFERIVLHAIYDLSEAEFVLVRNLIEALPGGGVVILFNTTANIKPTQFAEWTWQRFIKDENLGDRTFPEFCRPSSPNSALLERLFVFDAAQPPLQRSESLSVLQARSRYHEIEAIGSRIAGLLLKGEAPGDIAVVVRHIETYGEMIEDVFARYGIPLAFETGVPLLRVPFIKYWFAVQDLVTSERSRDALARVMSSAYFEPRLSPKLDVEGELASSGYLDRHHLPASDLARRRNSPRTPVFQQFESLLDSLEKATEPPSWFLDRLGPPPMLTSRDREGWRILQEELQSVNEVAGRVSIAEFRAIAAEVAALRTVDRLSSHATAPGLAGVRVTGPQSLGYRDYRWLFVPGVVDGEFPARTSANPLLQDGVIEAINSAIRPARLQTTRDRHRREPLYLFMALESGRTRVTLTFPGNTLEGEPMTPSIYVGEIARHFGEEIIEGVAHDALPARDSGERLRRIASAWRSKTIDDFRATELLGADIADRIRKESLRAGAADVGRDVVRTDTTWHPSELNALQACPFVFLARYRLRLRRDPFPEFDVTPLEVGKLAHDVLREFHTNPVPAGEAEALERMRRIMDRKFADADIHGQGPFSVFEPALWNIRRSQLAAALEQYARFAVRDALDGFETVKEYLDQPLPSRALGTVLLGGRPDHVAVRRLGSRIEGIRIDDFKYSVASNGLSKQLRDSFQIPIYAFLAMRAVNADETAAIDGRYLLLKSPSTPVLSQAIDSEVFLALQDQIENLVNIAREGRLHPAPSDPQECSYCDYRRLCRLYGS